VHISRPRSQPWRSQCPKTSLARVGNHLEQLSSSWYYLSCPERCTSNSLVSPVFDKAPLRTVIRLRSSALERRSTLVGQVNFAGIWHSPHSEMHFGIEQSIVEDWRVKEKPVSAFFAWTDPLQRLLRSKDWSRFWRGLDSVLIILEIKGWQENFFW